MARKYGKPRKFTEHRNHGTLSSRRPLRGGQADQLTTGFKPIYNSEHPLHRAERRDFPTGSTASAAQPPLRNQLTRPLAPRHRAPTIAGEGCAPGCHPPQGPRHTSPTSALRPGSVRKGIRDLPHTHLRPPVGLPANRSYKSPVRGQHVSRRLAASSSPRGQG